MADEQNDVTRLEDLRRQWAEAPTPRLAVRLAEELRRRGETADAVEVLEKGLAADPEHLAVRVALGRYRIELGQLEEAREALEEVADRDPTHLLANKLLADLYTRLGEREKARDRLDLYILLNDKDPEIPALEARLEEGPAAAAAAEPLSLPTEPFDLGAPEAPVPDLGALAAPPVAPARAMGWAAADGLDAVAAVPPPAQPFGELWSASELDRLRTGLAAEGIFPFVPIPAAPAVAGAPLAEPGAEATRTLAQLYERQGHVEEAESIYRRLGGRDAGDLGASAGREAARAASLRERKKAALRDYLERIRGGSRPG